MSVSRRANSRVAHGGKIEREKALIAELQIVERRHLHNEVMRVLTVGNRNAERGFALLKEQRITPIGDCGRFKADHDATGKNARTDFPLSHTHEPIRREKSVSASHTRLLLIESEYIRVEHEHPVALPGHEHGHSR